MSEKVSFFHVINVPTLINEEDSRIWSKHLSKIISESGEILNQNVDFESTFGKDGMKPLHVLAKANQKTCLQKLSLCESIDFNVLDSRGWNAAFYLVENADDVDTLEMLKQRGVDLNHLANNNSGLFHIACANYRYDIIKALLNSGIDPSVKDSEEKICVEYAHGHPKHLFTLLSLFKKSGVDIKGWLPSINNLLQAHLKGEFISSKRMKLAERRETMSLIASIFKDETEDEEIKEEATEDPKEIVEETLVETESEVQEVQETVEEAVQEVQEMEEIVETEQNVEAEPVDNE
eukprot:TRINITY_DN1312_c0_g1_i1.p1 TRINITY_DN1312_c0_g1~~TRINITY_DN1312_c0_g1_i1.p1  ORF type:complete len:292 (+),score=120.32 TRINITY_DN1312_c0_g1_i1:29-904(+)